MKTLIYTIIIALIFSFMIGCKAKTIYVPIKETEIVKETLRDTVIHIELVPYRDSVVTKDTISYLENKYAYSWSKWSNGLLYHSLGIFDIKHPVEIKYIDREVIKEIEVPYPVVEIKEVNKLSSFQSFQVWCGRILLILLGGYGLFRLVRWKFFL